MKNVRFTLHAETKFKTIQKSGFSVTREDVIDCLRFPDKIDTAPNNIKISQKGMGSRHVLRVVFREDNQGIKVITFHPGNRRRYEKKKS